jgi:hypothetical protein
MDEHTSKIHSYVSLSKALYLARAFFLCCNFDLYSNHGSLHMDHNHHNHNKVQNIFCDVMPIMIKAAPVIASYIGSPLTYVILGLLAAITNCDATNHEEIADKLENDPDLYAKLANLESTHAEWLNYLHSK